jgi:hypothetical protein
VYHVFDFPAAALPAAGAQAAVVDKPWIFYAATYRAYPVALVP